MRDRVDIVHGDRRKLLAYAVGCIGIAEEHGAERDVRRAARGELDDILAAGDAAHADDRQPGRRVTRVHRGERDRLERRPREPASRAREERSKRRRVES